jgi:hypothetical protein
MYLSRMNYAATHGVGMSEGEQSKWVRVMPERVNHDNNGLNVASPWFLHNNAHGIIRSTSRARASCQCLVASWLGKLFTVLTSPRTTTKSTHNTHGVPVMLKTPKITQVPNRCLPYISISHGHHMCQYELSNPA